MLAAASLLTGACDSRNLEQQTVETVPETPVISKPAVTTITAGFESTGTKSILYISGNYASVLWQSGDSFTMRSINTEGSSYYPEIYTTSFSGDPKVKADFTGNSLSPLDYYLACYPSSADDGYGMSNGKPVGRGILPKKQTATANTYDKAANLAFAYAPAASGYSELTFRNATALLKVRVTGAKVSQLDSIRVQNSDDNMAGLITVSGFDSELLIEKNWISEYNSQSVALAGPFTANVDYYIVVAPGTYSGFSVVFFFNDGSTISKTLLNQAVTFNRSTIRNLGTFELNSTTDDNVRVYTGTTPTTNHASICVIPDGFQTLERETFFTRAQAGMDYLFSVSPYKELKNQMKVYFIWTPSEESGASITDGHGNITTLKHTAFGTKWGGDKYEDMRANDDAVYGFVAANCPDIVSGAKTIDQVPILILVNDTRYGGRAINNSNGKTYCMVPYIEGGAAQSWQTNTTQAQYVEPKDNYPAILVDQSYLNGLYGNSKESYEGDWRDVLVHEFGGHSFGRLADEYWYNSYYAQGDIEEHSWTVPFGLNVTGWWYNDGTNAHPLPWAELMTKKATLVETDAKYGRIGVYQGGDVSMFNRWRSEEISCMIDNRPYFSAWQRVLIAKRIHDLAGIAFNLDSYLSIDNPTDPVRDGSGSGSSVMLPVTKSHATIRPMLPPPILIDENNPATPLLVGAGD